MRRAHFHGYTIYEDGTILGLKGKALSHRNNHGRYEIRLNINGKRMNFLSSRLVYHAFQPFDIDDKDLCVTQRDGDKLNIHLDNLYLIERKDLIQGDKHRRISKLTDQQVKEIRDLYEGKTGSNQHDKVGYSLKDLADRYGVKKSNVAWIIKGRSRNADNYKLK